MQEVSSLADIMSYFNYIFIAYSMLLVIIAINVIKAFYVRKREITPKCKWIQIGDVIVNTLCGIAMYFGILFAGVLADNNAPNIHQWMYVMMSIAFIGLLLYIIHLIIIVRINNRD